MDNDFNAQALIQSLLNADTDDFAQLVKIVGLDILHDFSGADLRNVNLENAELINADLSNANFENANLREVNLTQSNLSESNFTNADLSGANLENSNLRGANFTDANLEGANFNNANLKDAIFGEATLINNILSNTIINNRNTNPNDVFSKVREEKRKDVPNNFSADSDREYFLLRVKEELESEGEDLRHLSSKARDALMTIARRIAVRLRTTVEKVLDALEKITQNL